MEKTRVFVQVTGVDKTLERIQRIKEHLAAAETELWHLKGSGPELNLVSDDATVVESRVTASDSQ